MRFRDEDPLESLERQLRAESPGLVARMELFERLTKDEPPPPVEPGRLRGPRRR